MKFSISLEKGEELRCHCSSNIYLHNIWHDDAERLSQVHCPLIINFK